MSEVLTYDDMGNIKTLKRDNGTVTTYNYTVNSVASNRLQSLTGGMTGTYTYDANGNATKDRTGMTFRYNHLNLPDSVWNGTVKIGYLYDANGAKLRKYKNNAVDRDYVGGFEYAAGNIEMIHTGEGYIQRGSNNLYTYHYNLTDHLGNVRATLQRTSATAGTVIQKHDYYPFGKSKALQLSGINKYLYNGKEVQSELGDQQDYGARFYDAEIGRWNVVDPLADLYESWSPYSFAFNNPVRYIDPDGKQVQDQIIDGGTIPEVVVIGQRSNVVESIQTALDVIGFIPLIGEVADAANGIIYAYKGDWGNAAISFAAVIPVVGEIGKVGRLATKFTKLIDKTKGVSGVYEITTKSGKKYIGQSKDVGKRLNDHSKSAKFEGDEIVDVKVTEVKGNKVDREVFEQKQLNNATDGDGARSVNVLNERNPIGPNRQGEMARTPTTGKTFKM